MTRAAALLDGKQLFITFAPMKKVFTLFLISIYLFSATDIKELLKMNVVMEHYHETVQTDGYVSFVQFLEMHYVTDDNNSKDNNRDVQLPFKSTNTTVSSSSFQFVTNQVSSLNFNTSISKEKEYLPTVPSFICSNYQAMVWHPPQVS